MEPQWDGAIYDKKPLKIFSGTMPIYGKKPLKIFSRTKGPMTLGLGMQHWGLWPNKDCSNDDLGLTLTFFTARSSLLPYAFIWENIHFFRINVRKSFNGRNLQQMTRVTKALSWYKNFDPKGLSTPALELYTCTSAWKNMCKIRLQRDFLETCNKWSKW